MQKEPELFSGWSRLNTAVSKMQKTKKYTNIKSEFCKKKSPTNLKKEKNVKRQKTVPLSISDSESATREAAGTPAINKPVSFLLWHVKMSAAVKSAALHLSQLLNYSLTVYAQVLLCEL